jgi:pimeloyl-ACP methyl ester carboxylesterase
MDPRTLAAEVSYRNPAVEVLHFPPVTVFDRESRTDFVVRTGDGTTLSCWSVGDGPVTLLLLHGWGGSSSGRFWLPLLQRLDLSGIRVIAADLRGHGKSDNPLLGFTTENFANDMFAVLDRADARHPILVGYSMSARWVQWMSCMQPERVAGQVLISPAPALALPLTDDMLNHWLSAGRDHAYFQQWLRQFVKEPLAPEIVDGYFEDLSGTAEHSLRETFNMCRTGEFTGSLTFTRAASLVISGLHDPVLSPQLVHDEVVNRIPGARLALVECGHEIPLEKPLETAGLIQAFVAGLRTSIR